MTAVAARRFAQGSDGAVALLAVPLFALVLIVHGFLPGFVNDGPWNYLLEGDLRCLDAMGLEALKGSCAAVGIPDGYRFLTSGPVIAVGWLAMRVPGVGSYPAYLFAGALFDALALWGGYALMRRLGARRTVALVTAAAYLVAPSVVGLRTFGGTFTGFVLLPAYAALDLAVMERFAQARARTVAAIALGYAVIRIGALFMDGYSFVVATLLSIALWTPWLLRRALPWRRRVAGLATVVLAPLVAYLAYVAYVPSLSDPAPIALFRSMGADLVTFARPSQYVWGVDLLGLSRDYADLWGDGSNARFNYLGLACVALALVALVSRRRDPVVVALAIAGAIAFVVSLGPSLKIDDRRPSALTDLSSITYDSYLMPATAADVSLPWEQAFTALPGLEQMRATYRWSTLTRLALVVLAGLGIELLLRRDRRRLALLAAALALLELAPNLPLLVDRHRDAYRARDQFTAAVVPQLTAATARGERVFYLDAAGGPGYVVNYLTTTAGLRSYNAGGDKNGALAAAGWPPQVLALAVAARADDAGDLAAAVADAFAAGVVDAVVVPSFDLRLAAYEWPPAAEQTAQGREPFVELLADPRFAVERHGWLAVVRPRAQ